MPTVTARRARGMRAAAYERAYAPHDALVPPDTVAGLPGGKALNCARCATAWGLAV